MVPLANPNSIKFCPYEPSRAKIHYPLATCQVPVGYIKEFIFKVNNKMKSTTTIKLKLTSNNKLLETMKEYSKAVAYIADKGFTSGVHNRYELHHLCYYEVRAKYNLPSQFIINANRVASQRCSHCGKLGTRSKGYFVCSHCGYSLNSDLNASYNLAKHHSMSDGVSGLVTAPYIQGDEHKGTSCAIACELMDKSPLPQ